MSFTNEFTDRIFCRYFPESSKTIHFPIVLLIVVLYGQNHRRIKKSSVLFGGFSEKIQLIQNFHLNIIDGITDGLKNHR